MSLRDTAVAIIVGTILLLLLSRWIGRVQFSLSNAFWCSFISFIFSCILSVVAGLLMGFFSCPDIVGIVITLVITWLFQTVLFQIVVRSKNGTLARWRAAILSLVVILGTFFISSPLIELWEHLHQ